MSGRAALFASLFAIAGCAHLGADFTNGDEDGGAARGDASADSSVAPQTDGGRTPSRDGGGTPAPDGSTGGGTDAGSGNDAAGGGTDAGLDPLLGLPDPSGMPCNPPDTQCPGVGWCRIDSPNGGRCEGCPNGCALVGQSCVKSADCDIDLQCYDGTCRTFCHLATPQECGNASDCIDVGNDTVGICRY